mmetsp:Transcript_6417/g.18326  ORF Transcript_6417/g.18326 Transcript_6417/m.18326 type:complete len:390 (+) Transcript_6417:114-1283(+)
MQLNRTIESVVVVLAFHHAPNANLKLLFHPTGLRGLGNVRKGDSGGGAPGRRSDRQPRTLQHGKGDQKRLGLRGDRVECDQLPGVQGMGPRGGRLHQALGMGETGPWFLVPALAGHEHSLHPERGDGAGSAEAFRAKVVEPFPRLLLAPVQQAILGRVGPETSRIGRQVHQGRVPIELRLVRGLIERRTGQGHQRHVGRLELFRLAVPLGSNHVGQSLRGNREDFSHGSRHLSTVQCDAVPLRVVVVTAMIRFAFHRGGVLFSPATGCEHFLERQQRLVGLFLGNVVDSRRGLTAVHPRRDGRCYRIALFPSCRSRRSRNFFPGCRVQSSGVNFLVEPGTPRQAISGSSCRRPSLLLLSFGGGGGGHSQTPGTHRDRGSNPTRRRRRRR